MDAAAEALAVPNVVPEVLEIDTIATDNLVADDVELENEIALLA